MQAAAFAAMALVYVVLITLIERRWRQRGGNGK
jgi:hypothetical protein